MGRLDHVFRVRLSGNLRGLVLQEAERQGVTASQLTRAALAQAVGTKSSADRGAAVGGAELEHEADNESAPRLLATA